MEKKNQSFLDRMNEERTRAEKEYINNLNAQMEVKRIMREGITTGEELSSYVELAIREASHMEDVARKTNNAIVYSEAIGIKREFEKLLNLVRLGAMNMSEADAIDGTEENHRANNKGDEGYV